MNPDPTNPYQVPTEEEQEKLKKEFEKLKLKADSFKDKILKTHKKSIAGVALLPPKKEEKEKINILVVLDDSQSEVQPDFRLRDKLFNELVKTANSVDKNLFIEAITLNEVRESLFDSKYDILKLIALSAILYDPTDFLAALKVSEIHKNMTLQKFERYIVSYVAAGSLFRGEKSNDIDVYVIVDDTDVRRMSRAELKDKLRSLIISQSFEAAAITGVKKDFHVQVYILTDFWEAVKDAHPVMFTFLRDGVPIYDRGVFMPWRLLLKMGRIRPSPEAIDMQMDVGEKLIDRAKKKLLMIAGEDLYYGILNPSQAALMLYGVSPPTPKETVKLLDEIFVKKEKLLEKKYVDILEEIRVFFKDIEHGKVKEISGTEIDKLLVKCDDYLKRIKKLFNQIAAKSEKESFKELNDLLDKTVEMALSSSNINHTNKNIGFKEFCEKENLPDKYFTDYKSLVKAGTDYKTKKLEKAEVDKIKREMRTFIRLIEEIIQRKQFLGVEKAKVRFKSKGKIGEILFLRDSIFITKDVKDKNSIEKASLTSNKLGKIEKASLEDLEKALISTEVQKSINLTPELYDSLKLILGKDLELIL